MKPRSKVNSKIKWRFRNEGRASPRRGLEDPLEALLIGKGPVLSATGDHWSVDCSKVLEEFTRLCTAKTELVGRDVWATHGEDVLSLAGHSGKLAGTLLCSRYGRSTDTVIGAQAAIRIMDELHAEALSSADTLNHCEQLRLHRDDASRLLERMLWEHCCVLGKLRAENAPISDAYREELAVWADLNLSGDTGRYLRPAWVLGAWGSIPQRRRKRLIRAARAAPNERFVTAAPSSGGI